MFAANNRTHWFVQRTLLVNDLYAEGESQRRNEYNKFVQCEQKVLRIKREGKKITKIVSSRKKKKKKQPKQQQTIEQMSEKKHKEYETTNLHTLSVRVTMKMFEVCRTFHSKQKIR